MGSSCIRESAPRSEACSSEILLSVISYQQCCREADSKNSAAGKMQSDHNGREHGNKERVANVKSSCQNLCVEVTISWADTPISATLFAYLEFLCVV